jgi:hypothetical protein
MPEKIGSPADRCSRSKGGEGGERESRRDSGLDVGVPSGRTSRIPDREAPMAKDLPASKRPRKSSSTPAAVALPKKKTPARHAAGMAAKLRARRAQISESLRKNEVRDRKLARARETITKGLEQMFEARTLKPAQRKAVTKSVTEILDGFDPSVKPRKKKPSPSVT